MTASGNSGGLASDVVDGKTLWGSYGKDGSFLSQDGTTYVTPQGQVQHGITDPATGTFLQNGEVRTIDGHQVYGSVQNGTFYSEDGKILVTPNGFVEHGKTLPDGTFLASDVVDGKTLWGSYGKDGSFLSQDGTTYVTPQGQVQHGITDPNGNFLEGGTTKKLPNGTVLYGYMDGKDFFSSDGTTIVLSNGTVLHGHLDQGTGIFTADDGSFFFLGKNGIVPAKPEPDGSYLLGDGSTVMTPKAWSVDLPALHDAIYSVSFQRDSIESGVRSIRFTFKNIEDHWRSPAGDSFVVVTTNFNSVIDNLMAVLDEAIGRMRSSYQNYLSTEGANAKNLQ